MKKVITWAFVVFFLCMCLSCAKEADEPKLREGPKPGIVLITIDTLRADHLSGYGYDKPTSPNLDKLMARGVTFTHAYSTTSNTASSHASIMTGHYAPFHSIGAYNGEFQLEPEAITLAERLVDMDYWTGAVLSNPILQKTLGLGQGFHVYDDDLEGQELNRPFRERYADVAVDKALWVIERFKDHPFFIWLHLQDPHGPYDPPQKWLAKMHSYAYDIAGQLPEGDDHSGYHAIPRYQMYKDEKAIDDYVKRYDAEIAFADAELGRLFAILESHPQMADSLLIVTSDHGEALGEDGFHFAHAHSVGLDMVSVPLVMVGTGIPAGLKYEQPVSNAWIFDTVLDFVDRGSPGERSLLQVVRGSDQKPWDAPPAYMDSLNQAGVAQGAWFSRADRYPPDAAHFWQKNPVNNSFWKPLGRQTISLATLQTGEGNEASEKLLDAYLPEMFQWPQRFIGRTRRAKTQRQLEIMRSLGYAE